MDKFTGRQSQIDEIVQQASWGIYVKFFTGDHAFFFRHQLYDLYKKEVSKYVSEFRYASQ